MPSSAAGRVLGAALLCLFMLGATQSFAQTPPPVNTTDCASLTDADIAGSTDMTLSGDDTTDFTVVYNGTTFDGLPAGVFTLSNIVGDAQNVVIRANGTVDGSPGFDEISCNVDFNAPTCAVSQDPDSTVSPVDLGTVITLTLDTTNANGASVEGIPMTPDVDPNSNFAVAWTASYTAVSTTSVTGTGQNPDGATVECTWAINVNNSPPTAPVITQPADGSTVVIAGLNTQEFSVAWTESTDPEFEPITYEWELGVDAAFSTVLLSIPGLTETGAVLSYEAVGDLLASNGVNEGDSIVLFHRATASDGTNSTQGPAAEVTLTLGALAGAAPVFQVPLLSPAGLTLMALLTLMLAAVGMRQAGMRSTQRR